MKKEGNVYVYIYIHEERGGGGWGLTISYGRPSSSRTITTFHGLGPPWAFGKEREHSLVAVLKMTETTSTHCKQQLASSSCLRCGLDIGQVAAV